MRMAGTTFDELKEAITAKDCEEYRQAYREGNKMTTTSELKVGDKIRSGGRSVTVLHIKYWNDPGTYVLTIDQKTFAPGRGVVNCQIQSEPDEQWHLA